MCPLQLKQDKDMILGTSPNRSGTIGGKSWNLHTGPTAL